MKNLANKIVKKLINKKLSISVAESCTGGMLSTLITSINGASKIFSMGLVTYSNRAKNDILKIPKSVIKKNGSVSKECCSMMVNNLSKISKSNICLSITGIAGPKGGTKTKPVGLVYIGYKKNKKINVYKFLFKKKKRLSIQKSSVKKSLNLIFSSLN